MAWYQCVVTTWSYTCGLLSHGLIL